jgi:hypothetical protein
MHTIDANVLLRRRYLTRLRRDEDDLRAFGRMLDGGDWIWEDPNDLPLQADKPRPDRHRRWRTHGRAID